MFTRIAMLLFLILCTVSCESHNNINPKVFSEGIECNGKTQSPNGLTTFYIYELKNIRHDSPLGLMLKKVASLEVDNVNYNRESSFYRATNSEIIDVVGIRKDGDYAIFKIQIKNR